MVYLHVCRMIGLSDTIKVHHTIKTSRRGRILLLAKDACHKAHFDISDHSQLRRYGLAPKAADTDTIAATPILQGDRDVYQKGGQPHLLLHFPS